ILYRTANEHKRQTATHAVTHASPLFMKTSWQTTSASDSVKLHEIDFRAHFPVARRCNPRQDRTGRHNKRPWALLAIMAPQGREKRAGGCPTMFGCMLAGTKGCWH